MGKGTYTTKRITKLCEGLRGSAITSLECAAAPHQPLPYRALLAQPPPPSLNLAVTLARSLSDNQLCGIGVSGHGTYTTEGIGKLFEGLKGSAISSLKCAPALSSGPAGTRPHPHSCLQLGQQPALRHR